MAHFFQWFTSLPGFDAFASALANYIAEVLVAAILAGGVYLLNRKWAKNYLLPVVSAAWNFAEQMGIVEKNIDKLATALARTHESTNWVERIWFWLAGIWGKDKIKAMLEEITGEKNSVLKATPPKPLPAEDSDN